MKKLVLLLSLSCVVLATTIATMVQQPGTAPTQKTKTLVGRWEHTFAKGVWIWTIRANGTFSVAAKGGRDFTNGQYRVQNGIYDVNDANCNSNYHGRYRFAFFAADSLRFTVVEDTCRRRRGGTNGTGWKRLPDAD